MGLLNRTALIQVACCVECGADLVSAKTGVSGFYRDDAANIAAEAARASPAVPLETTPAGPVGERSPPRMMPDVPARPPLAPEPAINQNEHDRSRPAAPPPRRPASLVRTLAIIFLVPLYIVVASASAMILVLAAKVFLHF